MASHSPARAHRERTAAAQRHGAGADAMRKDATGYELMLVKLTEDKRRLHDLQSFERRAEVKLNLLPEYVPWIDGALQGGQGVQDDVLMTVMVWRIDAGDLAGALEIARYAIANKLAMPDQYKRNTACLLAEEFADNALRDMAAAAPSPEDAEKIATALQQVDDITANEDMPDEVRAKLNKAIGLTLGDKPSALKRLMRAFGLHDKVGVKKDIERLEREIKNSAGNG